MDIAASSLIAIILSAISAVIPLAMFLLVLWQAPRHRDNQLMALYVLTLCAWGTASLTLRLLGTAGQDPTLPGYAIPLAFQLNSLLLLALATHCAGLWRRQWIPYALLAGLVFHLATIPMLLQGWIYSSVTFEGGRLSYQPGLPGYLTLIVTFGSYLTSLVVLWVSQRGQLGDMIAGGGLVTAGAAATFFPALTQYAVPTGAAAFSSILFAHAILEEKVFNPLKRDMDERSHDLRIAAEISKRLSAIQNPDELLSRFVDLTGKYFNLYHAHVYLYDPSNKTLVTAAGTGRAGRTMHEREYSVSIEARPNPVTQAARSREAVILDDATRETGYLPNPLLPDMRSEMAVPMVVNDRLLGVLDMQSDRADRFTESCALVMATLAGQVATALQNAGGSPDGREAQPIKTHPDEFLASTLARNFPNGAVYLFDRDLRFLLVDGQDLNRAGFSKEQMEGRTLYEALGEKYGLLSEPYYRAALEGTNSTTELEIGGQVYRNIVGPVRDERGEIVAGMVVSQNISDFKLAAQRETLAYELGQQFTAELDPAKLLEVTVNRLSEAFGYYHAHVFLLDRERNNLVVREGLGEAGAAMKEMRHSIPLSTERSLVARAARSLDPAIVNDVNADPYHLPNPLLPETQSEVAVPIFVGERLLGVLDVQHTTVGHFDEGEVRTLLIVANQLATALSNAEAFAEQLRTERRGRVAQELARQLSTVLDPTILLSETVDRLSETLGYYHVHVYLYDEQTETLVVREGLGEAGAMMRDMGHSILLNAARSLVARAARDLEPVVVNDVAEQPDHLPNPLLPETRSEIAVPIFAGTQLIGVLDVQHNITGQFDENESRMLQIVANQLAIAFSNANLFEQVQEALTETAGQAHRMALLNEMSQELNLAADVEEIFKIAAVKIGQIVTSERASVAMLNPEKDGFEVFALKGEEGTVPLGTRLPFEGTALGAVVKEQRVIATRDAAASDYLDIRKIAEQGIRSTMSAPLLAGGRAMGTLNVGSAQPGAYTPGDQNMMAQIASLMASAIENRRLLDETESSARLLRSVIDATPDWIWVKDNDFRYLLVNRPIAQEGMGIGSPEEAIGKDDHSFYPAEIVDGDPERGIRGFRADDRAVLQGDAVHNPYERVTLTDGTERILDTQKIPLRDARGNIIGALGISRDVTERENIRRRQQTAQDIARQLTTLLDPDALLSETVSQLSDAFGYYHAQVYLLDTDDETLVVREGLGEVGAMMRDLGHRIPLSAERSLVARAARDLESVVVNNVAEQPDHLPNPLLPETCSEVAVPLYVGAQLLGVLDVQHNTTERFDLDEIRTLEIVAAQLAIALSNAELFSQVQEILEQSESSARLLRSVIDTSPDWIFAKDTGYRYLLVNRPYADQYSDLTPDEMVGKDDYDLGTPAHLIEGDPERGIRGFRPDDRAVVEEGQTVHNPYDPVTFRDGTEHIFDTTRLPLTDASGNVVGVLGIARDMTERRRSERRERLAQELAQQLTALLDPDALLRETVSQLAEALGYYYVHIYLIDEATENLIVREGLGEAGAMMKEMEHSIPLDATRSLVARAAQSLQPVVVNDVTRDPSHLPNPLLPDTQSEATIPLYVGERLLGVLDVQQNRTNYFTDDEVRTLEIVATQLSVALSNAELFDESAERLTIIESTDDLISLINTDSSVLYMNPAGARLAGYNTPDECVGKTIDHFLEPEDVRYITEEAVPTAIQEGVWHGETRLRRRDGTLIPVEQTLFVSSRDEQERPAALAAIMTDITERKRAEQRERVAQRLAQQLATLLDPDMLLSETVSQLSEAFGYYHAHVYLLDEYDENLIVREGLGEAGAMMKEMGHSIPRNAERSLVARATRTLEPVIANDVNADPDHLPNPLLPETRSEAALPLAIGERPLGVLDVQSTEVDHFGASEIRTLSIVANQLAVALSNAELYQQTLETADQLRELDRLKSEFLANMSHELRTPLNSIIGYSELLIDELSEQLDEMSVEDLKAIHSSGHHLLAIINDVLDLAKIEAGRLELNKSEIELSTFIPQVVDLSRVLLKDKPDVALQMDLAGGIPTLLADPVRLRQIIWNLLSNAIKFTDTGHVKLSCWADDGSWLYVAVEDTGVGIPEEHHDTIFDQFRQIDGSVTRKAGGTGLGLAITRQLVGMHGGDLWLESEHGQGTTFTFKLPLDPKIARRIKGTGPLQSMD